MLRWTVQSRKTFGFCSQRFTDCVFVKETLIGILNLKNNVVHRYESELYYQFQLFPCLKCSIVRVRSDSTVGGKRHNNGSATMFADSLSPEILPQGHHPLANCSQFFHHRVLVDFVIWDRLCVCVYSICFKLKNDKRINKKANSLVFNTVTINNEYEGFKKLITK